MSAWGGRLVEGAALSERYVQTDLRVLILGLLCVCLIYPKSYLRTLVSLKHHY